MPPRTKVSQWGISVPPWINSQITVAELEEIVLCEDTDGAYCSSELVASAPDIMHRWGDGVLTYIIQATNGDYCQPSPLLRWNELAIYYLSLATGLWADETLQLIRELELAGG